MAFERVVWQTESGVQTCPVIALFETTSRFPDMTNQGRRSTSPMASEPISRSGARWPMPFKDCALVAFDHVGATESTRQYFLKHQSRYLGLEGYVDDFIEVCSALAPRDPGILVGHSLGAMVGMLASLKKPALFSKLVLIGASPCLAGSLHTSPPANWMQTGSLMLSTPTTGTPA